VFRLIESDFGAPMVWYFNHVWDAELVMIGEDVEPSWYMIAAYLAFGAVLLCAVALPLLKIWRRRTAEPGYIGAGDRPQPDY
jgi:hypothetical protein